MDHKNTGGYRHKTLAIQKVLEGNNQGDELFYSLLSAFIDPIMGISYPELTEEEFQRLPDQYYQPRLTAFIRWIYNQPELAGYVEDMLPENAPYGDDSSTVDLECLIPPPDPTEEPDQEIPVEEQ